MKIRLGHAADALVASLSNGPGWRIPIWVQGCSLRCTEACLNPGFLDPRSGFLVEVGDLVQAVHDAIHDAARDIEGITVLGGEPTDQAASVASLCREVRAVGLSTVVYTGSTLEVLREDSRMGDLLEAVDLLVDGPFDPSRYGEGLAWRGSSNQRLLPLGERYRGVDLEAVFARQGKAFSLRVGADGRIAALGLQTRGGARRLETLLGGTGIRV